MVAILLTLISVVFVASGALCTYDPELFVRVWRRIAIGDYYVQTEEWRQKIIGLQGRLAGFVFLCAGFYGLYLTLQNFANGMKAERRRL